MKRLRNLVERAVRPVRASEARKNRMREELLGHLMALYDQERIAGEDQDRAVAVALARFGLPTDLTRELQHSVPRIERVLWAPLPLFGDWSKRRPGETQQQYLWRNARWQVIWVSVLMLLATLLAIAVAVSRGAIQQGQLIGPLVMFMVVATGLFAMGGPAFIFACELLRHQFAGWQVSHGKGLWRIGVTMLGVFLLCALSTGTALAFLPGYLAILVRHPLDYWLIVGCGRVGRSTGDLRGEGCAETQQYDDWDGSAVELLD